MNIKESILATLTYHDIFDYPLTSREVWQYQIGKGSTEKKVENELKNLIKERKIDCQQAYFSLKNRGQLAKLRISRQKNSTFKLKRANYYGALLKVIPTINLVALTGALSMDNSDKDDDIDLMIVTSKNQLWTTRLLVNLLLLPYKRTPGQPHTNNQACLNIFLAENDLKIKNKNLYTAHEIVQVRPLWQRGNSYLKFIKANSWVKNYLPNWTPEPNTPKTIRGKANWIFPESIAKKIQLTYMRKRITTEKIGDSQLFFHPQKIDSYVLKSYQDKLYRILGTKKPNKLR